MADASKVEKAVEWYSRTRIVYEALAKKVESIVQEILESENINYHSVTSRAKSIPRYEKKASEDKYKEPISEIFDMAGIRVITYTDSDARRVHEIINESFEIYPKLSVNKSKELGIDRVGYRSIHCVGALGKNRSQLPENQIFKDIVFEIQIRSILQHAWAEFEHDRNYKFGGILPKDIRRRLSISAGNLESIDREFDNISQAIENYVKEVKEKTEIGDLSTSINSKSLVAYMEKKFQPLVELGIEPILFVDEMVINELTVMGISTLEQFENIVPKDFVERKSKYIFSGDNFASMIRTILTVYNADEFFRYLKSKGTTWISMPKTEKIIIESYGVDLNKYFERHGMELRLNNKTKDVE